MNKPILFNASGGGNVIAYNYADDSWATPGWQELNIDCHCNYPHMELIEGNFAPHMGMSVTHGNAGYLTFYRNYSSSQFHEFTGLTGNVAAIELDTKAQSMNVVGNVLGAPGIGALYEETSNDGKCGKPHVFVLGSGYSLRWLRLGSEPCNRSRGQHTLASRELRLRHQHDRLGSETAEPHVARIALPHEQASVLAGWHRVALDGPDVEPKVGTPRAKSRFDSMK